MVLVPQMDFLRSSKSLYLCWTPVDFNLTMVELFFPPVVQLLLLALKCISLCCGRSLDRSCTGTRRKRCRIPSRKSLRFRKICFGMTLMTTVQLGSGTFLSPKSQGLVCLCYSCRVTQVYTSWRHVSFFFQATVCLPLLKTWLGSLRSAHNNLTN